MSDVPARDQVCVLIPAAGSGERLGRGPKAELLLHGRRVLDWVVDKALQVGSEVLVACAPGMQPPAGSLRIDGGPTRQESIRRLAAAANRPWCLLWDATSPFASVRLARSLLAAASTTGAAAPVVPLAVPFVELAAGRVQHAAPRTSGGTIGTPHAYEAQLLRAVTELAHEQGWEASSTIELMLRAGHPVSAVPGEQLNLKITTADDWLLAGALHHLLSS